MITEKFAATLRREGNKGKKEKGRRKKKGLLPKNFHCELR